MMMGWIHDDDGTRSYDDGHGTNDGTRSNDDGMMGWTMMMGWIQ